MCTRNLSVHSVYLFEFDSWHWMNEMNASIIHRENRLKPYENAMNEVSVMLVTWGWWQFIDVGDRTLLLVATFFMSVTKMAQIVNILKLSSTHFVSNIRHQNRCSHIHKLCNIIFDGKTHGQNNSHMLKYFD